MSAFDEPIRDHMTSPVHSADIDDALTDVEAGMREHGISCIPVVARDGQVVGVLSFSDLLQIGHVMARTSGGKELLSLPSMCAGDLMTRKIISANPDTTVQAAAKLMLSSSVQRLFVLDAGKPVGVFSTRNLMGVLIKAQVKTPISKVMTGPVATLDAAETIVTAVEKLYGARATGVVVLENGAPAGLFTQVEALAAREAPRTTPVGDLVGYSMICLPEGTLIDRAAGFALKARARRVLALDKSSTVVGMLTGLAFAAAVNG